MKKIAESLHGENQTFLCRICGHVDCHPTFRIREMMFGTREAFLYFKCKSCGCLQITDVPHDLSRHYPKGYYSHQHAATNAQIGWLKRSLEKLLIITALFNRGYKPSRIAKRFVSLPDYFFRARPELLQRAGIRNFQGKILDVGCGGQAQWLQDLQRIGFNNLLGIDPFIKSDLNVHGIPIRQVDVPSFAIQSCEHFDLITLHHSLEHIPNQLDTMTAVKKLLSPSGTCVIRIPTVSSLSWEIYGVNWVELDAPRHLFLHSTQSINILARQAGLEIFHTAYEADEFDIYGSKQYELDIPLTADNSYFVSPEKSIFSENEIQSFREQANELNRTGRAGRAAFYMRHV